MNKQRSRLKLPITKNSFLIEKGFLSEIFFVSLYNKRPINGIKEAPKNSSIHTGKEIPVRVSSSIKLENVSSTMKDSPCQIEMSIILIKMKSIAWVRKKMKNSPIKILNIYLGKNFSRKKPIRIIREISIRDWIMQ